MFIANIIGDVTYLSSGKIPYKHAFTTRFGGVSEGEFASLNLGEHRGDNPENVTENYRRLAGALDIDFRKLVFSRQVHGTEVRIVSGGDARELFSPMPYEADGLVTAEKNLPLIIFTADCVPVLLCDEKHGVIAAVHCGWRSSVGDILAVAVKKMLSLGAEPAEIHAAIGPAIGACCFECGAEVAEAVINWLGDYGKTFIHNSPTDNNKFLIDLKGANRHRLITLGVLPENIDVSEICTMCDNETYWSHRATNGIRGSQAAIIKL